MPKLRLLIVATVICHATLPARAASVVGKAEIAFAGTSTLHDFEGSASPVDFALDADERGHWSAEIAVPVSGLDTGSAMRDGNMRSMLDAVGFPMIRGSFRDIDPDSVRAGGELPFVLTIRSVSRPARATVAHWAQAGDRELSFDARFAVSLAEFGLKAPEFLFVRVGDAVQVTVHVTLMRS